MFDDLPYILTGGANNTTTLSILVINQIRQGFNVAAALSTITFIIIFLVAFIFVRFLGANVVEQQTGATKGRNDHRRDRAACAAGQGTQDRPETARSGPRAGLTSAPS